jgi:twitching motility protein PilU
MDITPYLRLLVEKQGSDLHFTVGAQVKLNIEGKLTSVGKTSLTAEMTQAAAYGVMNAEQAAGFERNWEADFAIALADGSGRIRVNVFRQRGGVAMCLRRIPIRIPTLEKMELPEVLGELVLYKRGLILMVGVTGSGKSTTLAAMINHRNHHSASHVLTIEDPAEFSHPNCQVHRESARSRRGHPVLSTCAAKRAARGPDVIFLGEIRDRETMEAALELCNTGHLCLSTMHANNANQALERVINLFPLDTRRQLFLDLAANVRAIISQRLVHGPNNKRCAAIEIMINTPHIADLILKGELDRIKDAMDSSGFTGIQTFDLALYNLFKEGRIDLEER